MIIVESKRKKPATILKKYPDAILADVTSGAKDGLKKLSPFCARRDRSHVSRSRVSTIITLSKVLYPSPSDSMIALGDLEFPGTT